MAGPDALERVGASASERLAACLTFPEVRACRQVSSAWRRRWCGPAAPGELWDRDLGAARRADAWRGLLLGGLSVRALAMQDSYERLCATASPHDDAIRRDLARTLPQEALFRDPAGRGQRALFRLLRALAVHLWDVGYVQSLNFIIATLIGVFPEDEVLAFHCAQALLFRYSLVDFYRPKFPKLGVTVWQFDRLVEGFLPKVHVVLHRHGVTSEYYAMQWFLTLFASDLSQHTVRRIWDRFLVAGWEVVAQVGLALLYEVQDSLQGLDTCEALTFLKRFTRTRRFEAEALLKSASAFDVSHRMLSELEAAYEASCGAAPAAAASRGAGDCGAGAADEPLPLAQLVVAKDLGSGEVCWEVQRPPAPSPPEPTADAAPRPGSAGGVPEPVGAGGAGGAPGGGAGGRGAKDGGTVLPFLFHDLDTGETTLLEEAWGQYQRERQAPRCAEADRAEAPAAPARAHGVAMAAPRRSAGDEAPPWHGAANGGAFWLSARKEQALQALRRTEGGARYGAQ